MKKIIIIFFFITLCGCAKTDAPITNSIADNAKKTLDAIKESLPPECRTETINAQINALDAQINDIPNVCQAEINPIKAERDAYKLKFHSVLIGLVVFFVLLIKKK